MKCVEALNVMWPKHSDFGQVMFYLGGGVEPNRINVSLVCVCIDVRHNEKAWAISTVLKKVTRADNSQVYLYY
jgi:hypothetical protein